MSRTGLKTYRAVCRDLVDNKQKEERKELLSTRQTTLIVEHMRMKTPCQTVKLKKYINSIKWQRKEQY